MADQQTCSNCGGQLPVGALFCTQCGTRFTEGAAAAPTATTPVASEAPAPTSSPSSTVAAPPPAPRPAPEAPPAAAAAAAGADATRIVTPQADPTQMLPTAPPAAPTPAPAPEAPGAWQPAPPPPAPTWGSAPTAPPTQAAPATAPFVPTPPPAPAAPGAWDQPTQAPTGAPPAGPPPAAYAAPAAAAAGYAAAPDPYAQPGGPVPGGAPAPAKARRKNLVAALLAVLGGAALIVAAFLPWYRAHLADGSIVAVSGWNASNDAKTILGLGAAAIIFSLLVLAGIGNTFMRLLYFAGFVASAAVLGYDFYDIHSRLTKNADVIAKGITQIDIGLGIWVGFGGSVLLLLVALAIRRKPKVQPTGFTPPAA